MHATGPLVGCRRGPLSPSVLSGCDAPFPVSLPGLRLLGSWEICAWVTVTSEETSVGLRLGDKGPLSPVWTRHSGLCPSAMCQEPEGGDLAQPLQSPDVDPLLPSASEPQVPAPDSRLPPGASFLSLRPWVNHTPVSWDCSLHTARVRSLGLHRGIT